MLIKSIFKYINFRYNWNRVVLFHARDGQREVAGDHTCYLMMQSLAKEIKNAKMEFTSFAIDNEKMNFTADLHRELGYHHAGNLSYNNDYLRNFIY